MTLEEPDARTRLCEAAAMWALSPATTNATSDTILAACDLLAEGVDSPGLRELAGLPFDVSWLDSRELVETVFLELSLESADQESDLAELLALSFCCRAFLRGEISDRELARWAYWTIGYEGSAVTGDLALLELDFDPDETHLWEAKDFADAATSRATAYLRGEAQIR